MENEEGTEERLEARLIRYADDFVVLCSGNTGRILKGIKIVLNNLELSLNDAKTKVVDARREDFNFLGFTIGIERSIRTGREFPLIRPSKKSLKHIKGEVKSLTGRTNLAIPTEVVIRKVNEAVRGWVGYFRYGSCSRYMSQMKRYLEERVQIYLRHKHRKARRFMSYPYHYLYENLNLYKIPTSAPYTYKLTAKADGRR